MRKIKLWCLGMQFWLIKLSEIQGNATLEGTKEAGAETCPTEGFRVFLEMERGSDKDAHHAKAVLVRGEEDFAPPWQVGTFGGIWRHLWSHLGGATSIE
jgi:hypothetical protein